MGGFLSFLFYTPTYLILLNTYSLCKIDDISWGTKGLDSKPKQNSKMLSSWKLIKMIHVFKFVMWNIIVAAVLLTLGADSHQRFWVTFALVCLIVSTQAIKVFIGILYMFYYRCTGPSLKNTPEKPEKETRMEKIIALYKPSILNEVRKHLNDIKEEYVKTGGMSFIQLSRNNKNLI